MRKYPVKSKQQPKELFNKLPVLAPDNGESFESIFSDFKNLNVPGITHRQHPSFFAYFPANSSPPSLLAEMLTATVGAQCMSWQTSPAATELEEKVISWLVKMLGLPSEFDGCIQDTASTSTLCAILAAREKVSDYQSNLHGLAESKKYVVYASAEAHSSIERAVRIAGIGSRNLRKMSLNADFSMNTANLKEQILQDKQTGLNPLCVVATIGTTGTTAIDSLREIGEICSVHKLWLHVDAAYAGSALILPEMRWMINGIEKVDSFVFNPHKWFFTNFDCSILFVRHKQELTRCFEILPEYLKTAEGSRVNNYRDWGIQLGRRFRALKLWFVIRSYGVKGLQSFIREHLRLAKLMASWIESNPKFELFCDPALATVCSRYLPNADLDLEKTNLLNSKLLEMLNQSGQLYHSSTVINKVFILRICIGQTYTEEKHVINAWNLIQEMAGKVRGL